MAQVIVLVIITAMINNDRKIGIMEESKKSHYEYCLTVKNREILKGAGVNVSLIIIHWKPYANNRKKSSSLSYDNKVDKYLLHVHNCISCISTDFVQWIVIVTSKSMHLLFHAKKVPKLELVLFLTIISLFLSLDPF